MKKPESVKEFPVLTGDILLFGGSSLRDPA
jgi:hypothetical protein